MALQLQNGYTSLKKGVYVQNSSSKIDSLVNFEIQLEKSARRWGFQEIGLKIKVEWGSNASAHRSQIHSDLNATLAKANLFSVRSISHCPSVGGYVFARWIEAERGRRNIGLDIEEVARVTAPVARRVCVNERELMSAPSLAGLWVAKEAAFKSLQNHLQPQTAFGIELGDWAEIDKNIFSVQVLNKENFERTLFQGLVTIYNNIAVCVFMSNY